MLRYTIFDHMATTILEKITTRKVFSMLRLSSSENEFETKENFSKFNSKIYQTFKVFIRPFNKFFVEKDEKSFTA